MANRSALKLLLSASSLLILAGFAHTPPLVAQNSAEPSAASPDHFRAARAVPQTLHAPAAMLTQLGRQQRAALSLAAGDFFQDGANGLVTGYSLGNSGVLAVQKGVPNLPDPDDTASPFAATATFLDAGLRPDFLTAADLNGDGHQDLVVGARGQSALRVLFGDGAGNFALQPAIPLAGTLSAVATWKDQTGHRLIVAAVCASGACALELHAADGSLLGSIPTTTDSIAVLEPARLNGNPTEDLIVGSAATLFVLDGASVLSGISKTGSPSLKPLPITGAVAVATGSFAYDRRYLRQIAVLTGDGSLHLLARAGVEPISTYKVLPNARQILRDNQRLGIHPAAPVNPGTLAWTDFEVLPGIAAFTGRQAPLLVRARTSMGGGDDLLLFNAAGGRPILVRHPVVNYPPDSDSPFRGTIQTPPAVVTTESASAGDVTAVLPLRVTQQGSHGLVLANKGSQPLINPVTAYHTYTVAAPVSGGDPATPGSCTATTCSTLRAAFLQLTADSTSGSLAGKADTINLPAGTYTLTQNGTDNNDPTKIHIEVTASVNLLGQGTAANTIITTSNADKIFSENSDDDPSESGQTAMDFYMSNITLTNGTNGNNTKTNGNYDGAGGLMDGDTGGTGYLTFMNCVFSNGTAKWGSGGGLFVSDNLLSNSSGPGVLEVDNSTFSTNHTAEGGGGLSTFYNSDSGEVPVILNGDTFTSNTANLALNSSDPAAADGTGIGGGFAFGTLANFCTNQANNNCNSSSNVESVLKNSTFTSNTATASSSSNQNFTGQGGGLWAGSTLTLTNNTFTNNTASLGGGIWVRAEGYTFNWTGLIVTGNTAQTTGGGVYLTSIGLPASISYSTIAGNKGSGTTGVAVDSSTTGAVTLTDNFWGCNTGANTTGCDKAAESNNQTLTLTPYAVLSASLNTTTPDANGGTVTVTGAIITDSGGHALGSGNLAGFSTLPATLTITQNGGGLGSTNTTLNTSASASYSKTLSSGGDGYGQATVYNATAQAPYSAQVAYPTLTIAFSPTTVAVNGTSTLTFTISDPNTDVSAQNVTFSDSLPTNLIVQTPNGLTTSGSSSCGNNATVTATAGSGMISFSGGLVFNGAPCTVTVNVTPTAAGSYSNTTGGISSSNQSGSNPPTSNTATLTATQPLTFSEAFAAGTVPVNGSTNLVFTLNNGTGAAQSAVAFSDTLPSGLQIGATPTTTCTSGTPTGTAGGSTFSLAGATLAVGASCTYTVSITGTTAGAHLNTSGTVSSSPAGTGATSSATLTVLAPPTVALTANYSQVVAGGKVVLTLTLTNSNASTTLTGIAIADTLPANLSFLSATNTCNGTYTSSPTQFALSGNSLAGGANCVFTATLAVGSTLGSTSTTTGAVSSSNGGSGTTASASTNVVAAPTLTAASPTLINRGSTQTVSATYTITAGSPAPTANFALYNGAILVASTAPTAVNSTTYTAAIPLASLAGGTYTLTVQYPGDAYYGSGTSTTFSLTVIANNIWIGNANSTTSAYQYNGSLLLTNPETSGGTGVAIDASGNIWSIAAANNSVAKYASTGTVTSSGYTGGGLSSPSALTIDGAGKVWITNANNSLSVFTNAGSAFSPSAYTGSLSTPTSITVDLSGNLWIANSGNNTVTEVLGAATPTLNPLSSGVATNQTATKP